MDDDKLKTLYAELRGILSQATPQSREHDFFTEYGALEYYDSVINELVRETEDNYDRFRLPTSGRLTMTTFKITVAGLIAHLRQKHFPAERDPLCTEPSAYTVQTTNVTQQVHIDMILQMDRLITKKIVEHQKGTKERTFLEKLQDGMKSASNFVDFAKTLTDAAMKAGVGIADIGRIFGF